MDRFFEILKQIFSTKNLRNKIFFTILMLVVVRIASHITIPGADLEKIKILLSRQNEGGLFSVFSLLTGGAMAHFSIILMGLTPYINASIIMQLLSVILPSIENLKKEGEIGQKKINQYTRILTVPLAFLQSYGMILYINNFGGVGEIVSTAPKIILPMMLIVTAGTIFTMWIGELITEKGIGNGISLLIFASIVSTVPTQVAGVFKSAGGFLSPIFLALLFVTIVLIIFVIYVSEADRRVPIIYSSKKSGVSQKSFLPLKINQAGMIPIIFAMSIISVPSILSRFFERSNSEILQKIGNFSKINLNPSDPTIFYNFVYAALIFLFVFFYVSIVFEPKKIAENIQKRNGYIPGYRPGAETEKFLEKTTDRLCFWGGTFLAFVAIVPMIFKNFIGGNSVSLFISGAGIIIVVGVVLDLIRQINAQLVMHDYDKL